MPTRTFFNQKLRVVRFKTFEIYHSAIGTKYYVLNQHFDKSFGIESTASRNAGTTQTFQAISCELIEPQISDDPTIRLQVSFGRVGSLIKPLLKQIRAFDRMEAAEFVYRQYLSTDTTNPATTPVQLYVASVSIDIDNVSMTADESNPRLINVAEVYNSARFPGLKNVGVAS